jgi:hypothetical protein
MKLGFIFSSLLLFTGCMFGTSQEIQRAETLLAQFQCHNVESNQIAHSAITSYHEQSLATSRKKAEHYIQSYKDGEHQFNLPLTNMVEEQYTKYHSACQALGGIPAQEQ